MTLEDAVAYYSEIAKECRQKARIESNDYMDMRDATYEAEQLAVRPGEFEFVSLPKWLYSKWAPVFPWSVEKAIIEAEEGE